MYIKKYYIFVRASHPPQSPHFSGRFFALCAITSRAAQHLVVCDSPFISFFPPAGGFCCLFKLSSLICYAQNVHVPVETGQGAVWAWHVGHSNEAALHMQHVCLDARNLETRLGPSSSSSCHLVIVVVHLLILLQCFCFIHQAAEELCRLSFPFYSQHFRFTLSSVPVGCIYANFVA